MKIINPLKKSEVICRHLHGFSSKFDSVTAIRIKLIDELGDQVPEKFDFNVGYYEGKQQAKIWLVSTEDLKMMYSNHSKGDITLWCDGRDTKETRGKRKRETEGCTNRQEREDEVDEVYKTLKEKHGTNYDIPRLRLWSRMICANIHEDTDNPPNIPAFSTMPSKKPRKNTFADAIEGAAVAFANAVSHKDDSSGKKGHVCCGDSPGPAVSPGKTVELRMKHFEQLRFLQSLFEDKILTDNEYQEQKDNILLSLRKLS